MKTDYTITNEYDQAVGEDWERFVIGRSSLLINEFMPVSRVKERGSYWGVPVISNPTFADAQNARNEYFNLLLGAVDRHDPTQVREPLIRTVCKIAARILFVLLLVGIAVGVMV